MYKTMGVGEAFLLIGFGVLVERKSNVSITLKDELPYECGGASCLLNVGRVVF